MCYILFFKKQHSKTTSLGSFSESSKTTYLGIKKLLSALVNLPSQRRRFEMAKKSN
jgi:hypothetical protein